MNVNWEIQPAGGCKEVDFGVYLDGGDDGEILLPTRYVPKAVSLATC